MTGHTTVAIPGAVLRQVERRAAALGISRSQVFVRTAERYLDERQGAELTARIDAVIDAIGARAAAEQTDWAEQARARLWAVAPDDDWEQRNCSPPRVLHLR